MCIVLDEVPLDSEFEEEDAVPGGNGNGPSLICHGTEKPLPFATSASVSSANAVVVHPINRASHPVFTA